MAGLRRPRRVDPPGRTGSPYNGLIAAASAVLAVSLYVAAYFLLGASWIPGNSGQVRMRVFDHEWLARVFGPAARFESLLRGRPLSAGTERDLFLQSP